MKPILKLLIGAVSFLAIAYILPGISIASFYTALIVALIWALISFFIRPILVVLTLPINILTLGLFTFILNGALLLFVSSFIEGFEIAGFWTAVLGAFLLSVIYWFLSKLLIREDK